MQNREANDNDQTSNWDGVRIDRWGYVLAIVMVIVLAVIYS